MIKNHFFTVNSGTNNVKVTCLKKCIVTNVLSKTSGPITT